MAAGSRNARVRLNGSSLTLEQVESIAGGAGCTLAAPARKAVRASRKAVEAAIRRGEQVYGVNTGFGHLARVRIDDERLGELQRNLVRSHSAGVGHPLPRRVVRAILGLRANCLARGHSGVRLETIERIIQLLDRDLLPLVPEKGSVGASGDLAPLAHVALCLIGEGRCLYRNRVTDSGEALRKAGLRPLELGAKEGLALINGTQVMSAIGTLALLSAERLTVLADISGAMSLEALRGSHRAFDRRIHAARPQPGQVASARNLRRLLRDSPIERSHRDCGAVQDSYSLRCMPQVHGAVRDALRYVRKVLEVEINSSTDNPMVFAGNSTMLSGGNFHGQPVSLALDHLATAVCSLGTISERRLERLVNPDHSGLPPFLAHEPGLHSGFMLAQVTAAALVSENKVLAHPASVDSISTSANKEDHVSMGAHAARKAAQVVEHVSTVLAIEVLCAAQALDLQRPLKPGSGVEAARRAFRRRVSRMREDRVLADDIEAARRLVDEQVMRRAAERVVGRLA